MYSYLYTYTYMYYVIYGLIAFWNALRHLCYGFGTVFGGVTWRKCWIYQAYSVEHLTTAYIINDNSNVANG